MTIRPELFSNILTRDRQITRGTNTSWRRLLPPYIATNKLQHCHISTSTTDSTQ